MGTAILENKKKNFSLKSTLSKQILKAKKCLVLSTLRLLHGKTSDDGREKPAGIKFYYFTKGGTDAVDQLSDYKIARLNCC